MTSQSPLGKTTDFPQHYAPEQLFGIERVENRANLNIGSDLPFDGFDIWNAWELTWLGSNGIPRVACVELRVPAASPRIVESKSLKLYLGSFAMTRFKSDAELTELLCKDLAACVGASVEVRLLRPADTLGLQTEVLEGECLDDLAADYTITDVDPEQLKADGDRLVSDTLHSHLLRSLCPVTGQPDSGSVLIRYRGPAIDRQGLLRYIVSYRQHADFHENCVERMFVDLLQRCGPSELTVYARYQRRGGIDINPFRSNVETSVANTRLWQQ